ncbi:hypothetical protein [Ramlibacter sp. PS4R-6]|uniref:hypothetical protein n=1 Tax=Ramlibacter sp. PS4R-6 TaxID=3133438 RepID=UPI0030A7CA0D
MDKHEFTAAAKAAFTRFGTTAHKAIDLYREGGERLATLAGERWDTAFEQSKKELDAETRKNAKHARDVFAGYYERGLALSADGAGVVVDTIVGAWIAGIDRVGSYKHA